MKVERAERNRIGIIPPTREEFALARSRGLNAISGEQLAEMRATARAAKRAANIRSAAAKTSPFLSEAQTIASLTRQVERLKQENTKLKIQILTGK